MADINKHITLFDTEEAYNTFIESSDLVKPNVSLVDSIAEVYYKTEDQFMSILWSDLTTSMDIRPTSDGVIPIGLCVIPKYFLPDGKARYMSLKYMSCTTPNVGSNDYEHIYWGDNTIDVGLPKYNVSLNGYVSMAVCLAWDYEYFQNNEFSWNNTPTSSNTILTDCYKPYQIPNTSGDCICLYDSSGKLNTNPYMYNMSSSDYSGKNYLIYGGSIGDFNGKDNTATILGFATGEDYKSVESLTNSNESGYFPAAEACWRYCPGNTSQGDWYLPSAGELAFILANKGQIYARLYAINAIYESNCIQELYQYLNLWSSTDYAGGTLNRAYYGYYNSYSKIDGGSKTSNSNFGVISMIQI